MDLVDFLDKSGLKADKIQQTRYQTLLASNGCSLTIDGAKVEVYLYDVAIKRQKAKLEKVKKNNKIRVLSLNIPAVVNGGMIMLTYSNHPNKAKIIRAFKKFPKDYKKH